MTQSTPLLSLTVRALGAIPRGRGVGFGGWLLGLANAKPLGISLTGAAAGQDVAVVVSGTAICEAGAAIALGAALALDDQGRVVTAAALAIAAGGTAVTSAAANGAATITGGEPPHFVLGDALQPAAAAGVFIEVLLRR